MPGASWRGQFPKWRVGPARDPAPTRSQGAGPPEARDPGISHSHVAAHFTEQPSETAGSRATEALVQGPRPPWGRPGPAPGHPEEGGTARTRWAHKPPGCPRAAGFGRPLPQAWPQTNPHIPRRPSTSLRLRGPPPAPGQAPSEDIPTVLRDPGAGTKAPAPHPHPACHSGLRCQLSPQAGGSASEPRSCNKLPPRHSRVTPQLGSA